MRLARRIISPFLAVILVLLGAFFVAEAIPQLQGNNQPLGVNYYVVSTQLFHRAWGSPYILGAGAALLAIGLVFLTLGIRRGPRPWPLAIEVEAVQVELPRRHLRRIAEAAALSLDDIAEAKVTVRRRRVKVIARPYPESPGDLADQVHQRVCDQIAALSPVRGLPQVQVRLKQAAR